MTLRGCRAKGKRRDESADRPELIARLPTKRLANRGCGPHIEGIIGNTQAGAGGRETGSCSRLKCWEITRGPRLSYRHQPQDRSQMAAAARRRVDAHSCVEERGSCRGPAVSRVRRAGTDRTDRLGFPRCRVSSSSLAVRSLRPCLDHSRAHAVVTGSARSARRRLGSPRARDETFALRLLAGKLACPADRFAPLPGRSL
jgi:hypothetical protein